MATRKTTSEESQPANTPDPGDAPRRDPQQVAMDEAVKSIDWKARENEQRQAEQQVRDAFR